MQENYRTELSNKLVAAQKRARTGREVKALKASAPSLFEIIDLEISMLASAMTADKPLSYEDYLDKHGQARGIMRIRNLLDSKEAEAESSAQEASAIQETLKGFENDTKQQ